jgi:hypothetical protein
VCAPRKRPDVRAPRINRGFNVPAKQTMSLNRRARKPTSSQAQSIVRTKRRIANVAVHGDTKLTCVHLERGERFPPYTYSRLRLRIETSELPYTQRKRVDMRPDLPSAIKRNVYIKCKHNFLRNVCFSLVAYPKVLESSFSRTNCRAFSESAACRACSLPP